jgi:benzoate transport
MTDPREVIATSPMSRLQVAVVGITIGLNALDGFDVLSISFASPGIMAEWGIDRAALGIVLSMELIGMAAGSVVLGGLADRFGRRPTMLGCLAVMAGGMFMATTTTGLVALSIWRVITGLGIGGMLAAINAVAAEFSNKQRRHLSVSLMSVGYPVGGLLGGLVAAQLLRSYDWRAVFYFGCAVTLAFVPIVYFVVPESVHWLARKQPAGALDAINRALRRMGQTTVSGLPTIVADDRSRAERNIFAPGLLATTVIVTTAYFLHITSFYYILKWVPTIVVRMGFAASTAAGVLNWYMGGGALGSAIFGFLTMRYRLKPLTLAVLLLSGIGITLFGQSASDLSQLSMLCFIAGFCGNAAIVGLYAIVAQAFPTHVRAFGTGFTIGVGRGGSALAPALAGFLFTAGYGLGTVSFTMALGSLLAAAVLMFLRLDQERPIAERGQPAVRATGVPATRPS